jgi:RNA polymerase sigma-B factor
LVASYFYLCRRGARKFLRDGLERCDLEQVAAIGLLKAGRRYERSSNTPFEAYAWILIVGELMHYVRDYEHIVRIPRSIRKLEQRCSEAFERLAAQFGREPSDREIAQAIGAPLSLVSAARLPRGAASSASIEHTAIRERGHLAPSERHADLIVPDRVVLEQALALLAAPERFIVVSHYVFGLTQAEIANHLGLSTRQISRLQHRALTRMRAHVAGAA